MSLMKRNSSFIKLIYPIGISLFLLFNLSHAQDGTIFPDTYGEELIQDLQQAYKPAYVLSYDNARDTMFAVIDNHNGQVTGVYSGYTITLDPNADPSSDAYDKDMNTEHTWPQSMGADHGNAHSDLHHLYPARSEVNSSRGNDPFYDIDDNQTDKWWRLDYYQTTIPTQNIDEYSEVDNDVSHFEPREDHKGNVARSMFYFYTMYRDQADSNFFNEQKETLRRWNLQDTVDAHERQRSQLVATYQDGKENPFVLDTTLVRRAYFYNGSSGTDIANPQNFTATTIDSADIRLTWTQNDSGDDVMIVWNTGGSFGSPTDGTSYSDGEEALGGMIIGRSSATEYVHSQLNSATTYYYKAFSVHGSAGSERYSGGTNADATTQAGNSGSSPAQPGDIIITEIMQNPDAVYDSDGEWFEIYNASDHNIDINGWFIKDNDTDSHQISNGGALTIQPGNYMVLGRNANSATNGGVTVAYQYSGIDLANGADEIILYLADGVTEIDRVEYDGGVTWPDPTGASMYFTGSASDDNNIGANWSVSTLPWDGSAGDLGSPGYGNMPSLVGIKLRISPCSFALNNYPNPFNPSTKIEYRISTAAWVRVAVYDLLGRKLRTIVNKRQAAGQYAVTFKGNGLASGLYLCKLQVGRQVRVHKMLLAR